MSWKLSENCFYTFQFFEVNCMMQFVLLVCRKLGLLSSFRESFSRLEIIAVSKKYNELEKVRKSTLLGSTYPPRKGLLPANQGLAWNLQTQKCRWGSFSSCFLALGAFQVLPGWGVDYLDPPKSIAWKASMSPCQSQLSHDVVIRIYNAFGMAHTPFFKDFSFVKRETSGIKVGNYLQQIWKVFSYGKKT